jgi:hypothetical protein
MTTQSEAQSPIRLNVKLASRVNEKTLEKVLASTPGLKSVLQTFPDEKDEELSRLFIIEVEPAAAKLALRQLNENPAIESAEPTAKRKLIW